MWVKSIKLENVKSFADSGTIELSKGINIFIGRNNSGKSTILRSLYLLQPLSDNFENNFQLRFARKGSERFTKVAIEVDGFDQEPSINWTKQFPKWDHKIIFQGGRAGYFRDAGNYENIGHQLFSKKEPDNFIYPFFSRRKPGGFVETTNSETVNEVKEDFSILYPKIDRLAGPDDLHHEAFKEACKAIIGFEVFPFVSQNGKKAGITIKRDTNIPLEEMGEGTINLLGMIVDLCGAQGKLFLIEEIENDIHPEALKGLLALIVKKSKDNQFVISTHSNIVLRYLGAEADSTVHHVRMAFDGRMPISTVSLVDNSSNARLEVLKELGYELFDSYLWAGYLILEESTAERLINDFLIPQFAPALINRLRTIVAGGVSKVEPTVNDFWRLFVFIHRAEIYRETAWVIVDGDPKGISVINELREKFKKSWPANHFVALNESSFEKYYPVKFREEADRVLEMANGPPRTKAKGKLAEDVVAWAKANEKQAVEEFAVSACPVIVELRKIDQKLSIK